MAERRDFMGYIGTGAIGSIVGYYAGAQKLLGIQSEEVARPSAEDTPTEDTPTEDTPDPTGKNIFDDFEDGSLDNPEWRAVGGGPRGLAEANEIGIANDGHQSQYALYLDQGGSISNFGARSTLDEVISPLQISFYIKPTSADQFTKNQLRLFEGDTAGILFNNHIQNDGLYFRFGDGNDEEDRERVRDGAIAPDIGRFVEIKMEQIDWDAGMIGEVYVDGERVTTNVPFLNNTSGFDKIQFQAIGGGETVFNIDDIGWRE
jgi:hypothetical protein